MTSEYNRVRQPAALLVLLPLGVVAVSRVAVRVWAFPKLFGRSRVFVPLGSRGIGVGAGTKRNSLVLRCHFSPRCSRSAGRHRGAPCDPRSSHPRVIRSWAHWARPDLVDTEHCAGTGSSALICPYKAFSLLTNDCRARLDPSSDTGAGRDHAAPTSKRNATWLILPVVICLSQRLISHACLKARSWTLGWVGGPPIGVHLSSRPFCRRCAPGLNWSGRASGAVTLKKLECSKQAYALDTLAWDNIIGFRRTTAKAFAKDVFINQERKLGARRRSDTVLVSTINDADQGISGCPDIVRIDRLRALSCSMGGGAWPFLVGGAICLVNSVNERDLSLLTSYVEVCDALRCSGPHARYTDVFNESIALADRPGKSLKFHRDGDRSLQLLVLNEES
ncbi:hypothetical protein LguiB_035866 [Lonicera macranthoides]